MAVKQANSGSEILRRLADKRELESVPDDVKILLQPLEKSSLTASKENCPPDTLKRLAKDLVPFLTQLIKVCFQLLREVLPCPEEDSLFHCLKMAIAALGKFRSRLAGDPFVVERQHYTFMRTLHSRKRHDLVLEEGRKLIQGLWEVEIVIQGCKGGENSEDSAKQGLLPRPHIFENAQAVADLMIGLFISLLASSAEIVCNRLDQADYLSYLLSLLPIAEQWIREVLLLSNQLLPAQAVYSLAAEAPPASGKQESVEPPEGPAALDPGPAVAWATRALRAFSRAGDATRLPQVALSLASKLSAKEALTVLEDAVALLLGEDTKVFRKAQGSVGPATLALGKAALPLQVGLKTVETWLSSAVKGPVNSDGDARQSLAAAAQALDYLRRQISATGLGEPDKTVQEGDCSGAKAEVTADTSSLLERALRQLAGIVADSSCTTQETSAGNPVSRLRDLGSAAVAALAARTPHTSRPAGSKGHTGKASHDAEGAEASGEDWVDMQALQRLWEGGAVEGRVLSWAAAVLYNLGVEWSRAGREGAAATAYQAAFAAARRRHLEAPSQEADPGDGSAAVADLAGKGKALAGCMQRLARPTEAQAVHAQAVQLHRARLVEGGGADLGACALFRSETLVLGDDHYRRAIERGNMRGRAAGRVLEEELGEWEGADEAAAVAVQRWILRALLDGTSGCAPVYEKGGAESRPRARMLICRAHLVHETARRSAPTAAEEGAPAAAASEDGTSCRGPEGRAQQLAAQAQVARQEGRLVDALVASREALRQRLGAHLHEQRRHRTAQGGADAEVGGAAAKLLAAEYLDSLQQVGDLLSITGSPEEAVKHLQEGQQLARRLHAVAQEAAFTLRLGDVHRRMHSWDACRRDLDEADALLSCLVVTPEPEAEGGESGASAAGAGERCHVCSSCTRLLLAQQRLVRGDLLRRQSQASEARAQYAAARLALAGHGTKEAEQSSDSCADADQEMRHAECSSRQSGEGRRRSTAAKKPPPADEEPGRGRAEGKQPRPARKGRSKPALPAEEPGGSSSSVASNPLDGADTSTSKARRLVVKEASAPKAVAAAGTQEAAGAGASWAVQGLTARLYLQEAKCLLAGGGVSLDDLVQYASTDAREGACEEGKARGDLGATAHPLEEGLLLARYAARDSGVDLRVGVALQGEEGISRRGAHVAGESLGEAPGAARHVAAALAYHHGAEWSSPEEALFYLHEALGRTARQKHLLVVRGKQESSCRGEAVSPQQQQERTRNLEELARALVPPCAEGGARGPALQEALPAGYALCTLTLCAEAEAAGGSLQGGEGVPRPAEALLVTRATRGRPSVAVRIPLAGYRVLQAHVEGREPCGEPHTESALGDSLRELQELLGGAMPADGSDDGSSGSSSTGDAAKTEADRTEQKTRWWAHRIGMDRQLGELLRRVDEDVLGPWRCLLLGETGDEARAQRAAEGAAQLLEEAGDGAVSLEEYEAVAAVLLTLRPIPTDAPTSGQLSTGELGARIHAAAAKVAGRPPPRDGQEQAVEESTTVQKAAAKKAVRGAGRGRAARGQPPATSTKAEEGEDTGVAAVQEPEAVPFPMLLVLDAELAGMPWESTPALQRQQCCRLPSLAALHVHQASVRAQARGEQAAGAGGESGRVAAVEAHVDVRRTYYLLNPTGDLTTTQAQFEHWFAEEAGWSGAAGAKEVPSTEGLIRELEEHDLFVYFGHGGGERFVPPQALWQRDRCAATLLMGCSSGRLKALGDYEPLGVPLAYLAAGGVLVVANLWDVTDRDIDRFSSSVLHQWLGRPAPAPDAAPSSRTGEGAQKAGRTAWETSRARAAGKKGRGKEAAPEIDDTCSTPDVA
eukprot:gene989-1508_t